MTTTKVDTAAIATSLPAARCSSARTCDRAEFLAELAAFLDRERREQTGTGAILFIHLDDAADVDDTFIEHIAAVVRSTDLVSQLGDRLIALLCPEMPEAVDAVSLSERVHTRLRTHGITPPSRLSISMTIAEHGYLAPVHLDVDDAPDLVTVRLFGSFEVVSGDRHLGVRELRRRPKQVLQLLVAARGRTVTKEALADRLWEQSPPPGYVTTLESYISTLRRDLEPGVGRHESLIETHPGGYRFAYERASVDIERFDQLVAEAEQGGLHRATARLEQALCLVRGEVLADEPYADWAEDLRDDYRRRLVDVLIDCGCCHLSDGAVAAALARAEQALSLDGSSDAACRLVMVALYRDDRASAALRAYDRFNAQLEVEYRVEPSPATVALATSIQRQAAVEVPWRRPRTFDKTT
jgi:DNA-binding SARP family transcriptional activator